MITTAEEYIIHELENAKDRIEELEDENRAMCDHIVYLDRIIRALSKDICILKTSGYPGREGYNFLSMGTIDEDKEEYRLLCDYFNLKENKEDAEQDNKGEHTDLGENQLSV